MSTFLQLCQDVARESGTFPTIGTPETTVEQSGRLARLVFWVRDAYLDIQRTRPDWRWLRSDFSGQTIADVQPYAAAAMGITERFADWIHYGEGGRKVFTTYLTSDGMDHERYLEFRPWPDFRSTFMVGGAAALTGPPQYVTVNDQNELVLYPTPDAAYTVRGRYVKAPQTLEEDLDIPELPEMYHSAIKWRGLILLGMFDEATVQQPQWDREYTRVMGDMLNRLTPNILQPEPLA